MTTMKQIAKKTGVSINAVSLALNGKKGVSDDTRKKIIFAADELGYTKRMAYCDLPSYKSVCVMLRKEYYSACSENFYPRVIYGIDKAAKNSGYNIVLSVINGERSIPAIVTKKRVCGIILLGIIEDEFLVRLKAIGLPIVLVDHASVALSTDCVLTDNRFGTMEAVRYLLRAGYHKIGFFGDFSYSNSNRERFLGYQEALMRFGGGNYTEKMDNIIKYSILDKIEPMIQQGDALGIAEVLKKKKELPEAFQCSNDTAAFVLNNALKLLNYRVPEQIGLVGFDDKNLSAVMMPSLTTLHVANATMGQKAFQKLLWRLENPDAHIEKVKMRVNLVVRASTRSLEEYDNFSNNKQGDIYE